MWVQKTGTGYEQQDYCVWFQITNVLDEKNARRSAKRVTSEGGDDFYFGSDWGSRITELTIGQPWFFLRQRETRFENLKTTHRVDLDKPKAGWPWCCLLNPVSNLLWHLHAAVGPYRRVVCLQNLKIAENLEIDIYPPRQLFPTSPKLGVLVYIVYTPYI